MDELIPLVTQVSNLLLAQNLKLATAESCTGGWIAQQATVLPGSSDWFDAGFVTYSNEAKQSMLGVCGDTLDRYGAVSESVVQEMVKGAIARSGAEVAVAVSGVAGPTGGSPDKPVGTVWVAWGRAGQNINTQCFSFAGDREEVRWQTVIAAYEGLLALLKE